MSDNGHGTFGVRFVAWVEAIKGVLALAIGGGVLTLLHHDVASAGEKLLRHLHLNPAKDHPHIFLDALSGIHDTHLILIAAGAALYAAIRLVLAVGLWYDKVWAEWLAAIAAAIYIPFEIYELARGITWLRFGTFVCNIIVVLVLANAIRRRKPASVPL